MSATEAYLSALKPPSRLRARLKAHLQDTYGITVKKMTPLEPWAKDGTQRVDIDGGPSWVARWFPTARPLEQVEADAEMLRIFERDAFPAERCAHEQPVSSMDGHGVLVTELLPAASRWTHGISGREAHQLGDLHGRLHTYPREGPMARKGGGWHHLSFAGGDRTDDAALLLEMIDDIAPRFDDAERGALGELREAVAAIDGCPGLPGAVHHPDFGGPNVLWLEDGPHVIDWAGTGWGPRVHALSTMLAVASNPRLLDGFVAGYRQHVQLTPEELDRLPDVLGIHSLVLSMFGV